MNLLGDNLSLILLAAERPCLISRWLRNWSTFSHLSDNGNTWWNLLAWCFSVTWLQANFSQMDWFWLQRNVSKTWKRWNGSPFGKVLGFTRLWLTKTSRFDFRSWWLTTQRKGFPRRRHYIINTSQNLKCLNLTDSFNLSKFRFYAIPIVKYPRAAFII